MIKKTSLALLFCTYSVTTLAADIVAPADPNQPVNIVAPASPPAAVHKPSLPPVNWVSESFSDVVTIANGSGAALLIQITVAGSESAESPGIKVNNCGTTKTIKAGSSAICTTSDAKNPVSFSSDATTPASGTYQIIQQ